MWSRRSFLRLTSAGVAAAAASKSLMGASTLAQERQPQEAMRGPLPPAIAALPSMTPRVRPITNEERMARVEKAKSLMTANEIDAIALCGGTSTLYFANAQIGGGERLWAVVIPARANPFIVCPAFEEGRAREILANSPFGSAADIRIWQEDENPFALLITSLKDHGISTGRLGIEEEVKYVFSNSLANAGAHAIETVSATPVTAGCRMIKSDHEVECIRLAAHATLSVYEAVYKSLKVGMTGADVQALIHAAYAQVGFVGEASMNIGEYTALPHGSRTPQTIREGTIIMLDDGCRVEGFTSDITRTFVLGKPTDKMAKVFDIVHAAQQAALKAARPGVVTGTVDAAARKVIVDAGYGPGFKYFTHRVGHGLGMDMHEWPYLVDNNMWGSPLHPVLQANMTTSDEPGIYIPGEFGIRLEDDMHVTEDGAELLTPASPSLEDPFGSSTSS
ncbi:MAG TPA: Xaa-Pro peptidase family protein [Candidatus Acidoferrales bacterium]|nr:Xaa-Pro peptidase family protein [Candidatus Acidoferrales bacterium]